MVQSDAFDWMTNMSVVPRYNLGSLRDAQNIIDNVQLQRTLREYMASLQRNIKQRPFPTGFRYNYSPLFAGLLKNPPDPMTLLRELHFPRGEKYMTDVVSDLAGDDIMFRSTDKTNLDAGLKFLNNGADWMLEQDPRLDGVFSIAYPHLMLNKAKLLLRTKRYAELEEHLEDSRIKVGSNWTFITTELINPPSFTRLPSQGPNDLHNLPTPNKQRIEEILNKPPIIQSVKHFSGLLVTHNFAKNTLDTLHNALLHRKVHFYLTQDANLLTNSWSLNNANVHAASGQIIPNVDKPGDVSELAKLLESIHIEERKNLISLEKFVRFNPDNHDAIDMYCAEAEKFLPDKELETKILNLSRITHTPPSTVAYSKMTNKKEWSALASRVIAEGLLKLNESPFSPMRDPWLNLSLWEDLDIERNAIDWYAFMKDSVFWHAPRYYFSQRIMPGAVFLKYINQATRTNNWDAVLVACRARYEWEKKNCQNERMLGIWKQAEEKLRVVPEKESGT
jgi:hypothetical protein